MHIVSARVEAEGTNMPRILSLLDNDRTTFLVPEVKSMDTNMPRVLSLLDNYRLHC